VQRAVTFRCIGAESGIRLAFVFSDVEARELEHSLRRGDCGSEPCGFDDNGPGPDTAEPARRGDADLNAGAGDRDAIINAGAGDRDADLNAGAGDRDADRRDACPGHRHDVKHADGDAIAGGRPGCGPDSDTSLLEWCAVRH
jgi:hypothetical protein